MSKLDFKLAFVLTGVVLISLLGLANTKRELEVIKRNPHKIIQENMSEYAQMIIKTPGF